MNRSLILTCLILCFSSAINCYNFEKICKNDVFKYKNSNGKEFEVNTVYRLNFDMKLEDLYDHTIKYNYDFLKKHLENNDHAIRLANAIKLWDTKILELYSEDYINNQTKFKNNIENDHKLIVRYFDEIMHIKKHVKNYLTSSLITVFAQTGFKFVANLHSIRNNLITYDHSESILKSIEKAKRTVWGYGKTYVLDKNTSDVIKSEGIIQKVKFIFHKVDGDEKKRLESKGNLILNIMLPYYDKNYDGDRHTIHCLESFQLPKFYNKN